MSGWTRWGRHVAWVGAFVALGCQPGDFADSNDSGGADTDAPATSDTDTGTATAGDADTDPTGPNDTGPATATGGSTTGQEPDPQDVCDLQCGAGFCELDENQAPVCVCDDGYVSVGLDCIPCQSVQTDLALDIGVVDVELIVTIGDAPPPATEYEDGLIWLRNTTTGDEVYVGKTSEGDGHLFATVLPGVYEVFYEFESGGALVPQNRSASLGVHRFDNDASVPLELEILTLAGEFRIDGAPAPDTEYEHGKVYLRDRASGDEVYLGKTFNGTFQVQLLPGTYDVVYAFGQGGAQVPLNPEAIVDSVTVQDQGPELLPEYDVDLVTVAVQGNILLDGQPAPTSEYERGAIMFHDLTNGAETFVADTNSDTLSARLIAGEYDVYYGLLAGGAMVPINKHARVLSGVLVDADNDTVDIDIQTQTVTGEFLLDGAPAPATETDDGTVWLRNLQTGDEAYLGKTSAGSFSRRIVRGEYGVYFSQETPGGSVPANTNGFVQTEDLEFTSAFDVNIQTVDVAGQIDLAGSTPPDSEYDDARLYLRNLDTGDSVLLGNTRLAGYSRRVMPGLYDLVYVVETPGNDVPINAAAILQSGIDVGPGTLLDIDVPVVTLTGAVTLEQAPPPVTDDDRARVFLQDVQSGDEVLLGSTWAPDFARRLAPGRYLVRYRSELSSGQTPSNSDAAVACYDLIP